MAHQIRVVKIRIIMSGCVFLPREQSAVQAGNKTAPSPVHKPRQIHRLCCLRAMIHSLEHERFSKLALPLDLTGGSTDGKPLGSADGTGLQA
jgi:hypothetical protein